MQITGAPAGRFQVRRRALVAGPLSFLMPGLGQLYNGELRRALIFGGISMVLQVAGTVAFSIPPTSWLVFLSAVVMALSSAVFRVAAMIDAAWRARRIGAIAPTGWNRALVYVAVLVASVLFAVLVSLPGNGVPRFRPYYLPAESMVPTIRRGEHFMTWRAYYATHSPERGEVAVFKLPRDPSIDYVKRIVGLPGDRIQMVRGVLHINGEAVRLERLPDWRPPSGGKAVPQFAETLPSGHAYRIIEYTDSGEYDNTPVFVVPADHFFALGDNRDNSLDSRVSSERYGVGFVPRANLRDRPMFLYWSAEWGRIGAALD